MPFLIIFVLGFGSCLSPAKGQYSNLRCEPSVGIIKDEPDFGIDVKVTVKNTGKEGEIKVFATLSTSEGEWSREQKLIFNEGESRNLTYFFHEPTINIDKNGIQCRIKVSPSAE